MAGIGHSWDMSTNALTAAEVLATAVRIGRDNMAEYLLALEESEHAEMVAKAKELGRRIRAATDAGYLVSTDQGDYALTSKGTEYMGRAA